MPVNKSKQVWIKGAVVKVGFLTLTITGYRPTPGDGAPDAYELVDDRGRRYEFVPHKGINRIDD